MEKPRLRLRINPSIRSVFRQKYPCLVENVYCRRAPQSVGSTGVRKRYCRACDLTITKKCSLLLWISFLLCHPRTGSIVDNHVETVCLRCQQSPGRYSGLLPIVRSKSLRMTIFRCEFFAGLHCTISLNFRLRD